MSSRTSYLIKNGTIVDGSGKKGFQGDVLVVDDKIEKVGDLEAEGDFKTIDAKGMIVCPGFIDVNNHSDSYWTLFDYPGLESLVTQGISSIVCGNCGSSIAPILGGGALDSIQKYVDIKKVSVHWGSFKDFLNFLRERKLALNFASLVGHSTIRRAIIGDEFRQLSKEELEKLKFLLEASLDEGAFGMSTGLVYSHAKVASKEEIIELAKIVSRKNGVYATHLRQEGEDLIASVKEAISVARASGVNLEISHLKSSGIESWPKQDQVIELIENAREEGLNINFDVYPYIYSGPVLYTLLPAWSVEGGKKALMKRLKDPAIRQKIVQEMLASDFDYGKLIIATFKIDYALPRYRIEEIAKNQGRSPEDVVIDLILSSDDTITVIFESLNTKNVEKLIAHDLSIISTNGAGYNKDHQKSGDLVHQRCFGAIPKFLNEYSVYDGTLELEKSIHKITQKPAKKFGLKKIGLIKEGNQADLAVFDPKSIGENSKLMNPYRYSSGIKELFINGKLVILNYELDNERPGRALEK